MVDRCHVSRRFVAVGRSVRFGDAIGAVGKFQLDRIDRGFWSVSERHGLGWGFRARNGPLRDSRFEFTSQSVR